MFARGLLLAPSDAARPAIRTALIGAGVAGRMVARHLLRPAPGIRLVAVANRTVARAVAAFARPNVKIAKTVDDLDDAIAAGEPCAVADARLACTAPSVDVVIEATGTIEFGAEVVLTAIAHRKHVILLNAELDATLGPILKVFADRAGVVLSNADGDEPGVAMTLIRYLRAIGLQPVAAGNIKGMIDRYRTPDTQREFARQHGQNPVAVTSFADGTKLALESAVLANATGFHVAARGMIGHRCAHVSEVARLLPLDRVLRHGLIDYALGAAPGSGAFVAVFEDDPERCRELAYFKMGPGPLFVFHTPYHLPHIQIAASIQAAAWRGEATVTPLAGPVCQVAAVAKRDLSAGESLDGIGGFMTYGVIENSGVFEDAKLLPIGVSAGCVLTRSIAKDQPLTANDVVRPAGRLGDRLLAQQQQHFSPRSPARLAARATASSNSLP